MGIPQEDGNMEQRPKKLLDQVRDAIRLRHKRSPAKQKATASRRHSMP